MPRAQDRKAQLSHTAWGNSNLQADEMVMNTTRSVPALGLSIMERIGNTPLLRLERVSADAPHAQIYGKAEWMNPGGSVKDRAAAGIVREAFRRGALAGGKRLLDSTSGNTGIAYAMLGAACGFGVTLCIPANVSVERKRILRAYGAEIIYTDPGEGSDGAIVRVREVIAEHPDRYFYADQYSNDANWLAHYHGTANEIWDQTKGRLTHFVTVLGTSGTFMGATRRLKELNPRIQCISLQPDSPFHGIEGAKYMPASIVPRIYDPALADRNIEISTEECYAMARRLAREEGLLVGPSSAASLVGGLRVARESNIDHPVVVCIFCDGAEKYLSERFWDDIPKPEFEI
jgi:S-sulfo-L-cysteine synthase (O-acetyl-L-serine-dependent)